jgi:RNA-directed DNA polymerase
VQGWRIPRLTPATLAELAQQYNSVIRGWWEYYGSFYQTAMREPFLYIDRKLEQWARRKYKTLSRHKRRSLEWVVKVKNDYPGCSSTGGHSPVGFAVILSGVVT